MDKNLKELLSVAFVYGLKFNKKSQKFILEVGPLKNTDSFEVIGDTFAEVVKEALAEFKT